MHYTLFRAAGTQTQSDSTIAKKSNYHLVHEQLASSLRVHTLVNKFIFMFGCVMYAMLASDLFMLSRARVRPSRCLARWPVSLSTVAQPVINHVGAERTIYVPELRGHIFPGRPPNPRPKNTSEKLAISRDSASLLETLT